jgi:hypothetical protein
MMNLQGQKALPGPAGVVNIAAAVMYSGGSHMCYADQPLALSQCSNCSGTGNATRQTKQPAAAKHHAHQEWLKWGCVTKMKSKRHPDLIEKLI